MSDKGEGVFTRIVAHIRALTSADWRGRAGKRFRDTMQAISDHAESSGITAGAEEGLRLAGNKIEGVANKEYPASLKDFAEAEQKKIETELQRRSLESDVRKKEAEAWKAEVDARSAGVDLVRKKIELAQMLKAAGVTLHSDADGNITVLPAVAQVDLTSLEPQLEALKPDDADRA